jgi:Lrp/AsnC family transcriptional regulator
VRGLPEILGVFRMAGNVDYMLYARVPDMAAYDGLYKRLIAAVELTDVSSSFVMEEIKNTTRLPLSYA